MINIPLRPKDDEQHNIPKLDKEILTVEVLTGWSNERVYAMFHPELATESFRQLNVAGKRECRQFHTYNKNKAYKESYEETLEEFLNGKKRSARGEAITIDDNKIENALKKLLNHAIGLLDSGDNLDPDSVKTIVEVFRKMNLLKDEEEQQIKPLRFLPLRCWGDGCRYRLFCESMVLEGAAIDECHFCKARAKAEELGYKFKDTELLNIPEDVVKRLEAKNNVTVADILSGKIEN